HHLTFVVRSLAGLDLIQAQGCGIDLILELIAGTACSGTLRIAGLSHKLRDYTVKDDSIIETLLRQRNEIFYGLRSDLGKKLDYEIAFIGGNDGKKPFSIWHRGSFSLTGRQGNQKERKSGKQRRRSMSEHRPIRNPERAV